METKKLSRELWSITIPVLVILLGGSCTSTQHLEPDSQSPIVTMPAEGANLIIPPTLPEAEQPSAAWTSTPTALSMLTPSPAPLPLTWTPVPTLISEDAQRLFETLLQTNGNCNLPCWWGITPGATPWFEAQQYLSTFVDRLGKGQELWITENNETFLATNYTLSFLQDDGNLRRCSLISIKNYEIEEIYVQDLCTSGSAFELTRFLDEIGQPDEIRFAVQRHQNTFVVSFGLIYSVRHIFISYADSEALSSDGTIHTCLALEPAAVILRATGLPMNFETIFDEISIQGYMPLSVLGMDEADFYGRFSNASNEPCIDIPESVLE